jgi:hypothetical protein
MSLPSTGLNKPSKIPAWKHVANWVIGSVRVRVSLQLTVCPSLCFGVEPCLRLVTRYKLLFDSYCLVVGRPLSREDGSVVCQSLSAVTSQLSVCTIFTFYMCHILLNTYTIYTRPLSVRAQYSRLCPNSGSFRYKVIGWPEISDYIGNGREMKEWNSVPIGSPWDRMKPLGSHTTAERSNGWQTQEFVSPWKGAFLLV